MSRMILTMSVVVASAVSVSSASAYFQTYSVSGLATKSSAVVGASCKKVGVKQGLFICKKVKGKLVLVRMKTNTSTKTTTNTIASTTSIPVTSTVLTSGAITLVKSLCSNATYTVQVTNLSCTANLIKFNSTGLPASSNTQMVGITGTNQQYPRPHNYSM